MNHHTQRIGRDMLGASRENAPHTNRERGVGSSENILHTNTNKERRVSHRENTPHTNKNGIGRVSISENAPNSNRIEKEELQAAKNLLTQTE